MANQRKKLFERIKADRVALAPRPVAVTLLLPSSVSTVNIQYKHLGEHPACFMDSWIIISTMTVNLNFF